MTTNQDLRIPRAGLLAILLLLPAALAAQTPVNLDIVGEVPITAPVVSEEEPGWREDPARVEEGTRHQLRPDEAMDALRSLGVLERLNTRGRPDRAKVPGVWERVGPVGGYGSPVRNGRISGIQVLPSGSFYRVYAGACQGGLWRMRSQYWIQWTDIGYNLPNPSVRAFAVDPDDFQHIFVATGDHRRYVGGGMFETTDEGVTWNPVSLPYGSAPEYFYRLLILGDDPDTGSRRMAAVCSFGPIWSDDGGAAMGEVGKRNPAQTVVRAGGISFSSGSGSMTARRQSPRRNQAKATAPATRFDRFMAHHSPSGPQCHHCVSSTVAGIRTAHSRPELMIMTGTVRPEPWNAPKSTRIRPKTNTENDVMRNRSAP